MLQVESDPVEKLDEVPVGSRMFIVEVYHPGLGRGLAGATVIETDKLAGIDEQCQRMGVPFQRGITFEAARQVIGRMFEDGPPDDLKVERVTEVSKRELKELIAASDRERAAAFDAGEAS